MIGVNKIYRKNWKIDTDFSNCSKEAIEEFELSPLIVKLLANRKVTTLQEIRFFFNGGRNDLPSPFLLEGMETAVDLLAESLRKKEKILVYGDYDVDGLTSVALVLRVLRRFNSGNIIYYIPKRLEEGYGLHLKALAKAVKYGCKLVITADCGITSCAEAEYLAEKGTNLLVTDHHEPGELLPQAAALINPKLSEGYPYPQLAGVGVTFKLLQGLAERIPEIKADLWDNIDLVALGTIADVVPLLGENRVLAKEGLKVLNQTSNPGLRALIAQTGLLGKEITAGHVGFTLAPRLNACGRLGDPVTGLRLLLEVNPARARKYAEVLDRMNKKRQDIEEQVLKEAEERLEAIDDPGKVIVLAGENWHPGVIGIVASRLVDKFYRPTVLLSFEGDKGKGSARSITGFHLFKALNECSPYLQKYGGHEMAAGLEIERKDLSKFEDALSEVANSWITDEILTPFLEIEGVIDLDGVTKDLLSNVSRLAPFGPGNPRPVLACKNLKLLSYNGVGRDAKHLKLNVGDELIRHEAIGFNYGSWTRELEGVDLINLAFYISENNWNNQIQLVIKDLQPVAEVS
jgi:single-stranded-DNA-specific exonuclease